MNKIEKELRTNLNDYYRIIKRYEKLTEEQAQLIDEQLILINLLKEDIKELKLKCQR
jgi:hypothetical protein